jgi:hypothetical protein
MWDLNFGTWFSGHGWGIRRLHSVRRSRAPTSHVEDQSEQWTRSHQPTIHGMHVNDWLVDEPQLMVSPWFLNGSFLNNQDTQWVVLNRYVFKRSEWVFPFFLNNQDTHTQWVVLDKVCIQEFWMGFSLIIKTPNGLSLITYVFKRSICVFP